MVIGTSRCAHVLCCLFCWRDGRRIRSLAETPSARPPLTYPVHRRSATLERKLAAGSLLWRTVERDAAMHPAPAEYPLGQRSRRIYRSRPTQQPLGAVRRPTLASGTRHMSAPVLRYVDARRPKSRAGSRLSLPSPSRGQNPPHGCGLPGRRWVSDRAPSRGLRRARDGRRPGRASPRGCRSATR